MLDKWLAEDSSQFCDQVVTRGNNGHCKYISRLWGCWCYHWQQAVQTTPDGRADGLEVAGKIRAGRGAQRGGRLGGDPLRDVVLAVAMTVKDSRAVVFFDQQYRKFSQRLAGKVHPHFAYDTDDWWNEFLDLLAGYTRSPGKLERFQGKCALRNWLGTVLWNFLRRRRLPTGMSPDLLETGPGSEIDPRLGDAEMAECLALFVRTVKPALDALSYEHRLLLKLLYVDRLPQKQAARLLGVHSGTAGRRRVHAIEQLRRHLAKAFAEANQEQAFADCLALLTEGGARGFADALCAVLRQYSTDAEQT